MFNRSLHGLPTAAHLILYVMLVLQGCATRSALMIHPQSGATITCGAAGAGILAGSAEALVEDCIRAYAERGYVRMESLTAEQRSDLQRRGLLPKPDMRPPRIEYRM